MVVVFQQAGVDFSKPVITMCTSGMVSSWIVACGLMCGWKDVPLYDVSVMCVHMYSTREFMCNRNAIMALVKLVRLHQLILYTLKPHHRSLLRP